MLPARLTLLACKLATGVVAHPALTPGAQGDPQQNLQQNLQQKLQPTPQQASPQA